MPYYTLINEHLRLWGHHFREGLNVINAEFSTEYTPGRLSGLYFATDDAIWDWPVGGQGWYHWIAEVTLCEDSKVVMEGKQLKTDRFILSRLTPISDWLDRLTQERLLAVVGRNGLLLSFVRRPTESVIMAALQQNGLALASVLCQTPAMCATAITQNPESMRYLRLRRLCLR
jgi:hypothetical protein